MGFGARTGPWATAAILLYAWLILIRHLRVEWTLNAQYAYGWAVPLLCAWLFWRRWSNRPAARPCARFSAGPLLSLFALLTYLSAGYLGLVLGAALTGYMSYFVGSYAAASVDFFAARRNCSAAGSSQPTRRTWPGSRMPSRRTSR